jgi:outer membrane protein assembly factor BamB
MKSSAIFVGIRGNVIALDRTTGQELWCAELKGADFVTVLLDGDRVLAATKGEMFCLDPHTGEQLWHNRLAGQGRGLVTIAGAGGSSNPMPPFREKQRRDEAAQAALLAST